MIHSRAIYLQYLYVDEGMDEVILDRIAFGGVKELEELYQQ